MMFLTELQSIRYKKIQREKKVYFENDYNLFMHII